MSTYDEHKEYMKNIMRIKNKKVDFKYAENNLPENEVKPKYQDIFFSPQKKNEKLRKDMHKNDNNLNTEPVIQKAKTFKKDSSSLLKKTENENEEDLLNIRKTHTTLIKNTKENKIDNNKKEKEKDKDKEKYDIIQERIKINIIQNLPIPFRTGDDKHRLIKQFRNFGDITRVKFQKKK